MCTRPSSANPSRGDYEIPIDDTQIKVTTQKEKQIVNACITNTGFYSNKYGKYFNPGDIYPNQAICDDYSVFSMQEIEIEKEIPIERKVFINSDDLCKTSKASNVCHIFVEHINLTSTEVFVQNNDRPIVIHLELPSKAEERRNELKTAFQYSFTQSGKLAERMVKIFRHATRNLRP